jgi:hypothetical protein
LPHTHLNITLFSAGQRVPAFMEPSVLSTFTKARYYNLSEPVHSSSHTHKYHSEICFNIIPPSTRKFHMSSSLVGFRISLQTLFTFFQHVQPISPLLILSSLLDKEHKLSSLLYVLFSIVSLLVMQRLNGLFYIKNRLMTLCSPHMVIIQRCYVLEKLQICQ